MDGEAGPCTALWTGVSLCDTDAGEAPNGAYATPTSGNGFYQLSAGAKVVENQLATDQGEYNSDFTKTAGSYYDKIWMSMLFTESVDNFISESRTDFVDKRYRSVSIADLFSDGYRRWLGNNLTNDIAVKGAHIPCTANHPECPFGAGVTCDVDGNGTIESPNSIGVDEANYTNYCKPNVDDNNYFTDGIGWTKWWGAEPQACFPKDGTNICSALTSLGSETDLSNPPVSAIAIDPQNGWESQKFLITWTYMYLMENSMHTWLDMLRMYSVATLNSETDYSDLIMLHAPTGQIYLAKRFGTEEIFGETVEKGISARVLQYANQLLQRAYVVTDGPDNDGDGVPDYYLPVKNTTGGYTVKYDETLASINSSGMGTFNPDNCDADDNSGCTCEMNRACMELEDYLSVVDWMAAWSGTADYDTTDWNDMIGIYN